MAGLPVEMPPDAGCQDQRSGSSAGRVRGCRARPFLGGLRVLWLRVFVSKTKDRQRATWISAPLVTLATLYNSPSDTFALKARDELTGYDGKIIFWYNPLTSTLPLPLNSSNPLRDIPVPFDPSNQTSNCQYSLLLPP